MKEKTPRRTFPLISLETGEIIIEEKRDGMTITPVQAELVIKLDLLTEYADELPLFEREVLMRKHCMGAYVYDNCTYKDIAQAMNSTEYHVKKAYSRAIVMLRNQILQ